jgi:hypothetical protein
VVAPPAVNAADVGEAGQDVELRAGALDDGERAVQGRERVVVTRRRNAAGR